MEPGDVRPSNDAAERRRYAKRGPTMRTMVRAVLARENVREFDRAL